MRPILLGLCLFAAACSTQGLSSPTSATSTDAGAAILASARTHAQGGTERPFRGSFTTATDVPPPSAHATAEGTAAHLGRFTGTLAAEVGPDNRSAGTFIFTAANGDELSGTFVGEGVFMPPNTARLTEVATIESGTGRFAGATGTFTIVRFDNIDFATGTATGHGTFEGQINMNR